MPRYEYKVIPAPKRGEKARGARTTEDRFALALTTLMNDLARDGWDYQRADTLPVEERTGLTARVSTSYQNMLIFRRALPEVAPAQPMMTIAERPAPLVIAEPKPDVSAEPATLPASAKLASVLSIQKPARADGPRLVSPFTDRKSATVTEAKRPEDSSDRAAE